MSDQWFQSEYTIDKTTQSPTDALTAFGFAEFWRDTAYQNDVELDATIEDAGRCFVVRFSQPLEAAWLAKPTFGLQYLAAGKHANSREDIVQRFEYDKEKSNNVLYRQEVKNLRAAKIAEGAPEWEAVNSRKPSLDYDYYAKTYQLSAIIGYNGLVEQWMDNRPMIRDQMALLLQLFSTSPNPLELITEQWQKQAKPNGWVGKTMASALQVVNPSMGKGLNRPKADGKINPDSLEGFWLLEYLKFLGARESMVPRTVYNSDDRKSYVIAPRQLSVRMMRQRRVFDHFRDALRPTTHIKMDILVVLKWMMVFLQQQTPQHSGNQRRMRARRPDHDIQGIWAITYKSLGSALAVMNVSLLRLPRWMRTVENENHAQRYFDLLREHERVVTSLEEKFSDEYNLLMVYRDFLSGAEMDKFYLFCAMYSDHILQRMERKRFVRTFTEPYLEELMMTQPDAEKKLSPILRDEGFRNIANAIRGSTVLPQYHKTRGERLYEIRYGLGGRLFQKSRYPDEFIRELTEFVFQYNQENARIKEQRGVQYRKNVKESDIVSVIGLIDTYDSETVAGLLIAMGYASASRDDSANEVMPTSDDDTEN